MQNGNGFFCLFPCAFKRRSVITAEIDYILQAGMVRKGVLKMEMRKAGLAPCLT